MSNRTNFHLVLQTFRLSLFRSVGGREYDFIRSWINSSVLLNLMRLCYFFLRVLKILN